MTNMDLTDEQKQAADDMVTRRMENTGESRSEASDYVINYLRGLASALNTRNGIQ